MSASINRRIGNQPVHSRISSLTGDKTCPFNTMPFQLHPDLKRDGIQIGRFPLCLVLLINDTNYPWFVLVPELENLSDTIDLTEKDHEALWAESREFGTGIMRAFSGEKLNIASLGNMTPQLHVHHVVRYQNDVAWPGPIWGKVPLKPYEPTAIDVIRNKLASAEILDFQTL